MDKLIVVVIFFMLVGIAVAFWGESTTINKWENFVVEHNCKITQKMQGHSKFGYSISGKPVYIPEADRVGWLCDDGVTYWR